MTNTGKIVPYKDSYRTTEESTDLNGFLKQVKYIIEYQTADFIKVCSISC